jgi:hypothetical protein
VSVGLLRGAVDYIDHVAQRRMFCKQVCHIPHCPTIASDSSSHANPLVVVLRHSHVMGVERIEECLLLGNCLRRRYPLYCFAVRVPYAPPRRKIEGSSFFCFCISLLSKATPYHHPANATKF